MTTFDIHPLPAVASADAELMRQITDLVNRVYATAEAGLWQPVATRTTVGEITRLAAVGELPQQGVPALQITVYHMDLRSRRPENQGERA
jgi:hypothetical protein